MPECTTVPSVNNTKSTVNGLESVPSVDHGTQVDYLCEKGFVPTTTQSVFCGSIIPGQVDVSNIKCNRRECTPPVLSGGSYSFKSRSSDHGDGSVVYNDVITYSCDVTHTMDASVTSPDLVCGADGNMATLASQNIKCNEKCTSVPSVDNSKTTVNGSASVTEVAHGTQIDYLCENGFFPTTTQSVFCGSIIPGQVDVP